MLEKYAIDADKTDVLINPSKLKHLLLKLKQFEERLRRNDRRSKTEKKQKNVHPKI